MYTFFISVPIKNQSLVYSVTHTYYSICNMTLPIITAKSKHLRAVSLPLLPDEIYPQHVGLLQMSLQQLYNYLYLQSYALILLQDNCLQCLLFIFSWQIKLSRNLLLNDYSGNALFPNNVLLKKKTYSIKKYLISILKKWLYQKFTKKILLNSLAYCKYQLNFVMHVYISVCVCIHTHTQSMLVWNGR